MAGDRPPSSRASRAGGLHGGRDRRAGPAGGAHPGVTPGRVPARHLHCVANRPPEPGPLSDACSRRDRTAGVSIDRETPPMRPGAGPRRRPRARRSRPSTTRCSTGTSESTRRSAASSPRRILSSPCGAPAGSSGRMSMPTSTSVACARGGSEPGLLGHQPLHLSPGGLRSQSARVTEIRERMLERDDELCTSTLTLGEVLVKPAEQGNEAFASDTRTSSPRRPASSRSIARPPADTPRSDATGPSGRRMPSSLPARLRSGWTSSSPMTIA